MVHVVVMFLGVRLSRLNGNSGVLGAPVVSGERFGMAATGTGFAVGREISLLHKQQ